jgi:bifunctional DNase/RNase
VIERGAEDSYIATVTVALGDDLHEIDARPSDALNLAVRAGGRVFVVADAMDAYALPSTEELEGRLMEGLVQAADNDVQLPGEWRSLTRDLISSLGPPETS